MYRVTGNVSTAKAGPCPIFAGGTALLLIRSRTTATWVRERAPSRWWLDVDGMENDFMRQCSWHSFIFIFLGSAHSTVVEANVLKSV